VAKQKPAMKKNVLTAIRATRGKGIVLANMGAKITLHENFHFIQYAYICSPLKV
jgi:hypothetical protein